ncbi:hypothetical protein AGMMS49525_02080 [Bacteroidia bacterium]|nr:hypothetical protein AGMMS49525_02080 [Bacteroidia bacterium]
MRKKQLFFCLLGLVALSSSCATDLYQSNPLQSSEREISFKTFADKQLRASVTTAGSMTSFTTSAWSHTDGAVSTANPYNGYVLNGVTVTRGEADGAGANNWDYFPKASWPARDSVDFFAYSPASSVNVTVGLKQNVTTVPTPPATGPEIEYTVPRWDGDTQVNPQEDFMVTKSVDLTFASSPTVQLNFKHALSRIVFKAQNQNKNKTYVIKELALSKLKSKGTLNMLDSVPNAADPFEHTPGAYDVAWKAQHDSVTYKVDLGDTYVLVPYGPAGSEYTAITNASNGLMVLPQETVLGTFTGSTPEYGTVAEIAASPADASYLYATVAEVDYLTNDTVNRRQVVFRLHDPANKAQGIVFEAGRQYTFLLTLGLDGEEIVFSIPTVEGFNTLAEVVVPPAVAAPFKQCGDPIKGYPTANYANTLNDLDKICWTTQNIAEGTAAYQSYNPGGGLDEHSGRGWYYTWSQGDAACAELGPEWAMPTLDQWFALDTSWSILTAGVGTSGTTPELQAPWTDSTTLAGTYNPISGWGGWDINDNYQWMVSDGDDKFTRIVYAGYWVRQSTPYADTARSLRCVRDI